MVFGEQVWTANHFEQSEMFNILMKLLLSKHCVQAFSKTVSIDIVSLHELLGPVYVVDTIIYTQHNWRE